MAVSKNFVVKKGLEVGGDTLFANSVTDKVGIGTTNPTSTFTVKGNTSLEDLTVSGVSTFSNNVAIGTSNPVSSLTVAGSGTSTSQLFVTGLSTFHNNAYIASDNRLYFGNETLSISFQSTPSASNYIETFNHVPLDIVTENLTIGAAGGEKYANFKVNSSVSLYYDDSKKIETSGLGVTVTGVTSTTYLYATGISTFIDGPVFIGSGTSTGTELQRLQVTGGGYFSSSVGIGITNPPNTLTVAGSGTSTAQLFVVGFSTFVGYSTFRDYVNIEDGLNVLGVSTFVGYSTFRDYVNIEDGLNVSGVSTFVGFSTFQDYVYIEDGLNVSGVSTFVGFSTFQDYVYIQDGLNVSGISTFVGAANFNSAYFGDNDKLYFGDSNDLEIFHNSENSFIRDTGTGTLNIIASGFSVLNAGGNETLANFNPDGSVELYYDNSKKFETLGTGVTVTGTTFTNQLNVSGISTFNDQVDIYSDVNVEGAIGIHTTILNTSFVISSAPEYSAELMCLDGPNNSNIYGLFSQYADETTITSRNGNSYGTIRLNQYDGFSIQTPILIPPSGNVGIGSTLPSSKLTVDGNVNVSGIVTAPTFVGNLTGTATTAATVDILNTNGLTTVYYPTFVESRTDGQIVRADVDLTYRTDNNTLTVPNIQLSSSGLTVGTGGTVVATTSGGSVGLGTATPVSKLAVVGGDASVGINTSQGLVLTSPNGTRYRLFVENGGTLKTVAI